MTETPATASLESRLAVDLSLALVGQGRFASGRPEARPALGALYDGLCRQLRERPQVAFLAGRPSAPLDFLCWGLAPSRCRLSDLLSPELVTVLPQHLAGNWIDRRLVCCSLESGLARQEFDLLFHLLALAGDRGPALRKRYFEEVARGSLSHVALLFADDLKHLDHAVSWPAQIALAWLQRDLNLLSRRGTVAATLRMARRNALLDNVLALVCGAGELCEFLAALDQLVDGLADYNRDEFAYLLLGRLEAPVLADICTELCRLLERLAQRSGSPGETVAAERGEAVRWITRRVADMLIDSGAATPAHYHALVLQKVLLYEEIPQHLRARVAALQVLTSFLANPQRYFAEIEGSQRPEILEKRLWRLLEMLPSLLLVRRFDVVREVVLFAQRFGASFDLSRRPDLLTQVRETVADVLDGSEPEEQAALLKALPQMGQAGFHMLIELTDHAHPSIRRTALEALCSAGTAVVPLLFETLGHKPEWHYRRNMLVILGRVGAGGPKVEAVFRDGVTHAEAGVRKEALPALARLLRENAAALVAGRLEDDNVEVRRRAVVCLALTGIADPAVYDRLAGLLAIKDDHDMVHAVLTTLNRLRPGPAAGSRLEEALITLAGGGGWFGIGRREANRTLRIEAIRVLEQFCTDRADKALERLTKDPDAGVAEAARAARAGRR